MKKNDSPPTNAMNIIVPSYFNPGETHWNGLIDAREAGASVWAILNPNDGPGDEVDQGYVDLIANLQSKGIKCIGYVMTKWLDPDEGYDFGLIEQHIGKWAEWYPTLDGMFLDEQSLKIEKIPEYAAYRDTIKDKFSNAVVITNPGTVCPEGYLQAADIICLSENEIGDNAETIKLPSWATSENASRIFVLGHTVQSSEVMKQCVDRIRNFGPNSFTVGHFYFTDKKGEATGNFENPWNRLPEFWNDMFSIA